MPVERWRGGLLAAALHAAAGAAARLLTAAGAAARLLTAAGAAALLLLAAGAAVAQPSERTLQLCAACHGVGGNSPTPAVPSLAAQPKVFVENQLVLVREGLRDIPVMKDAVKDLSDEQIVALAVYYAAQPLKPQPGPVRPERMSAGAELSRKGLCGSCHLSGYTGQQQVPRLAGQHETYLLAAMKQFRDAPGPGRDTIMAATLRGLADGDLENLAHYFAHVMAQSRP